MMGPIRVAVFEGDEIFRRGVVSCLDEDPVLEVVHQGAAYDEGSIDAPSSFDVAVVSAAVLEAALPTCPLVACVSRRTLAAEQLVSAVRAAAVGLRTMDSQAMTSDFDRRSLQVLRMLADGAAIREISSSLGWSERTIKGVIADIQREFQARSRTQAVVEALRRQLI